MHPPPFLARFRVRLRSAVAFAATVLALQTASAASSRVALRNWDVGYPSVTGERLNAVCWGSPGCVAVGNHGEILFSPDGSKWMRADSPVQRMLVSQANTLTDVCYGNKTFVAVGGEYQNGRILRSSDGLTWSRVPLNIDSLFRSVAFGGGIFTAVTGTKVMTSTDGLSWKERADAPISKIAYGAGIWVGADSVGNLCSSTDFVTWKINFPLQPVVPVRPSIIIIGGGGAPPFSNITYGNGKFIAVGGYPRVMWSDDGMVWNEGKSNGEIWGWDGLQGCAGSGGRFAVVGSLSGYEPYGFISCASSSGKTWTPGSLTNGVQTVEGYLTDVAADAGRPFIAVGSNGQIWKSANGISWKITDPVPLDYIGKIVHEDGKFVAVGGRRSYIGEGPGSALILSSSDGLAWKPFIPARTDILSAVAFGKGMWVATGDDGGILTSPDARDWTDRSIAGTTNDLGVLVYGAGRFIAFSENRDRIYHSTDGIGWQIKDEVPVAGVNAAAYLNGKFFAVGESGLVLVSGNGLDWIKQPLEDADSLLSICYGNGRYVAGALDHTATSFDGKSWKWHVKELAPRGISFVKGWFLSDDFRFSKDGVKWSRARNELQKFYRMSSIVYDSHSFVASEGLEIWKGELKFPTGKSGPAFR